MTRRMTILISAGMILAALAACATDQTMRNAIPASQADVAAQPSAYIIRPGDQLDIKFFYNPELNESVTVRPDGKITLQLVDEIAAAGLEPAGLDKILTEKYATELRKPVVSVIVKSFEGQRIYVGGEVNQQAEMTLPAGMTILQAVFKAGGFMETASPENTILIRQGSEKEPIPILVDLKAAMYGKGAGADLVLQPNDIVYIPKSAIAEADQWVNQYIEKLILFRGVSFGVTYQINKNKN